jgi:hypothetical protein
VQLQGELGRPGVFAEPAERSVGAEGGVNLTPVAAARPPIVRARDAYICVEMDRPNNRYRTLILLGWAGITLPIPTGPNDCPLRYVRDDGSLDYDSDLVAYAACCRSEKWRPLGYDREGERRVTLEPAFWAEVLRRVPERKRKRAEPTTVEVAV